MGAPQSIDGGPLTGEVNLELPLGVSLRNFTPLAAIFLVQLTDWAVYIGIVGPEFFWRRLGVAAGFGRQGPRSRTGAEPIQH